MPSGSTIGEAAKARYTTPKEVRALKRNLAADAPVIAGSAEHARLIADGKLVGRIVIAPDEPTPSEPIL